MRAVECTPAVQRVVSGLAGGDYRWHHERRRPVGAVPVQVLHALARLDPGERPRGALREAPFSGEGWAGRIWSYRGASREAVVVDRDGVVTIAGCTTRPRTVRWCLVAPGEEDIRLVGLEGPGVDGLHVTSSGVDASVALGDGMWTALIAEPARLGLRLRISSIQHGAVVRETRSERDLADIVTGGWSEVPAP